MITLEDWALIRMLNLSEGVSKAQIARDLQIPLGVPITTSNTFSVASFAGIQVVILKRIFSKLQHFTWWRIVRMMRTRHRWKWKAVRRWLTDPTGRWHPICVDGIELFNPEAIPITRYRYRGNEIPNPWAPAA